jgi:hypothetical protein
MFISYTVFTIPESYRGILVKSKGWDKRNTLNENYRLIDRICESVQKVTRGDCQAWIGHALSFFPRCKLLTREFENRDHEWVVLYGGW